MQPFLVFILLALLELDVSAKHVSTEYISESHYRERTSTDDSPEEMIKSKSKLATEGNSAASKLQSEKPEDHIPKSKLKSANNPSPKSSKISDKKNFEEKVSKSSKITEKKDAEGKVSKSKKKDSKDRKSKDKNLEKDKMEDSPINKDEFNLEFLNVKNIGNYENNGPPSSPV